MIRNATINTNTPEHYQEIYDGPRKPQLSASEDNFNLLKHIAKDGRILDVGCWTGNYFGAYNNCEVFGLEFNKSAVDEARLNYPHSAVLLHDIREEFPFNKEIFDFVFIGEVIEHLEEPLKILEECKSVLKDGGKIICTTPFEDQIRVDEHLWEYTRDDLIEMFKDWKDVSVLRYGNRKVNIWEHLMVIATK